MREHFYRTPKPRLKDGVPQPPNYMLIGADFIMLDDCRVASVSYEGHGNIVVRLVSASGVYHTLPGAPPGTDLSKHKPDVTTTDGGVRIRLSPHTALDLVKALRAETDGDKARLAAPAEAEVDVTECAHFNIALFTDGNTCVFLRALNAPYALRLDLKKPDADLFAGELGALLDTLTQADWDAQVEPLNVPCEVGPYKGVPLGQPLPPASPPRRAATETRPFLKRIVGAIAARILR